jgi:hypothetical protein
MLTNMYRKSYSIFQNHSLNLEAKEIWEEPMKRDLKDCSITKDLALDGREWNLAIHVLEHCSLVPHLLFVRGEE